MEADSPWESMRAEQENGELLSVDEREEAGREDREEEKVAVKEGLLLFTLLCLCL